MYGLIASVTGSAVVHRFYEYGVEGGLRYTQETTGRADALSKVKSYIDALGRTARVEQPGFAGTETTVYTYEEGPGLLRKVTQPGLADTLYEYDNELHQIHRTGLDVNGNGTLDALSNDRITQHTTTYALDGGAWWRKSVTAIYTSPGAYDPQVVETTWVKATDAFSRGGPSEERRIDMRENETTITVERDPEEHLLTRTVTYPGGLWEQTVTRNGQVQSSRSRSGIVTVYLYDGLGRRTGAIDPRRGEPSEVGYNAAGQVTYREDEAGYRTDYVYHPASGLLVKQLDPNEKTTYFAYTPRGELWRTWGDTTYPVEYAYDDWGRMTRMKTFRNDPDQGGWIDTTWPSEPPAGDTTTWNYDEASGLLESKVDAQDAAVTYTYSPGGRLATRTWARGVVTTYTYSSSTGDLLGVDYSDATRDLSYYYTRDGRLSQLIDATGTHTFYHNGFLEVSRERIMKGTQGIYTIDIYQKFETSPLPGRDAGFYLYGKNYDITYGYETATGRLSTLTATSSLLPGPATFQYTYVADSDLISAVEKQGSPTVLWTRGYEDHRDLVIGVTNQVGVATVSQYNYAYYPARVRTSVVNQGAAFQPARLNLWEYDDRYELTLSDRREGTDPGDPGDRIGAEYRSYAYDPIGNRTTAQAGWGATPTSYNDEQTDGTNSLNQYLETANPTETFGYDLDGDMTEDGTFEYTYDAENRLTTVEPKTPVQDSEKVEYTYDHMSRRIRRRVWTYTGGSWGSTPTENTKYVWQGWRMVAELDGKANDAVKATYAWGLDLSGSFEGAGGIGGLLMAESRAAYSNQTVAFFYDGNGNVTQLIGLPGGATAAHYEYDPYGSPIAAPANHWNPYTFSTKANEPVTGLCYYGYRFYSPRLGRWLTRDPIEEGGGISLYGFVGNRPVSGFDPKGKRWVGTGVHNCFDGNIHVYLKIDYQTWGFYSREWREKHRDRDDNLTGRESPRLSESGQIFLGRGIVISPDLHASDGDKCREFLVNDCCVDPSRFKSEAIRLADDMLVDPPVYSVVAYNCADFASDVPLSALGKTKKSFLRCFILGSYKWGEGGEQR